MSRLYTDLEKARNTVRRLSRRMDRRVIGNGMRLFAEDQVKYRGMAENAKFTAHDCDELEFLDWCYFRFMGVPVEP